jgi:hypothetical protein
LSTTHLDNGANSLFISNAIVRAYYLPYFPLAKSRVLGLADGSLTGARVTHRALIDFDLYRHRKQALMFVADL